MNGMRVVVFVFVACAHGCFSNVTFAQAHSREPCEPGTGRDCVRGSSCPYVENRLDFRVLRSGNSFRQVTRAGDAHTVEKYWQEIEIPLKSGDTGTFVVTHEKECCERARKHGIRQTPGDCYPPDDQRRESDRKSTRWIEHGPPRARWICEIGEYGPKDCEWWVTSHKKGCLGFFNQEYKWCNCLDEALTCGAMRADVSKEEYVSRKGAVTTAPSTSSSPPKRIESSVAEEPPKKTLSDWKLIVTAYLSEMSGSSASEWMDFLLIVGVFAVAAIVVAYGIAVVQHRFGLGIK